MANKYQRNQINANCQLDFYFQRNLNFNMLIQVGVLISFDCGNNKSFLDTVENFFPLSSFYSEYDSLSAKAIERMNFFKISTVVNPFKNICHRIAHTMISKYCLMYTKGNEILKSILCVLLINLDLWNRFFSPRTYIYWKGASVTIWRSTISLVLLRYLSPILTIGRMYH